MQFISESNYFTNSKAFVKGPNLNATYFCDQYNTIKKSSPNTGSAVIFHYHSTSDPTYNQYEMFRKELQDQAQHDSYQNTGMSNYDKKADNIEEFSPDNNYISPRCYSTTSVPFITPDHILSCNNSSLNSRRRSSTENTPCETGTDLNKLTNHCTSISATIVPVPHNSEPNPSRVTTPKRLSVFKQFH